MVTWELFAIVPGLILFLYGIDNFSKEIQNVAGEKFRSILGRLTNTPVKGAILGAIVTGIVQSSTATTVIAVSLVNAGTISFAGSLGIIIGANVGTTITAQLVALKLTSYASVFILIGFLLSIFGKKYKFLGKPIFYFGLVFFSLTLVSGSMEPLKDDARVIGLMSGLTNVFLALIAGFIFTVIVQSSSVTTGIVVLMAESGLITVSQGIPLLLGANIGTTTTALLASSGMSLHARRAALAHMIFNCAGVIIFLPFLGTFTSAVQAFGGTPAQEVANAHLAFNVICAVLFLAVSGRFKSIVERIVPGDEKEILFKPQYLNSRLPDDNNEAFGLIERELKHSLEVTISLFRESLRLLKDPDGGGHQKVAKLESLNDFLNDRIEEAILQLSERNLSERDAARTVLLVRISNAIEELGDSGEDVSSVSRGMYEKGMFLSQESRSDLLTGYEKLMENMGILASSFPEISSEDTEALEGLQRHLEALVHEGYRRHIRRLHNRKAYAGSMFAELISILEIANYHVRDIRKLEQEYVKYRSGE